MANISESVPNINKQRSRDRKIEKGINKTFTTLNRVKKDELLKLLLQEHGYDLDD